MTDNTVLETTLCQHKRELPDLCKRHTGHHADSERVAQRERNPRNNQPFDQKNHEGDRDIKREIDHLDIKHQPDGYKKNTAEHLPEGINGLANLMTFIGTCNHHTGNK